MQVNQLIRQHYPGTEVIASNYPPAAVNVAMSKLVNFGTMGAVATTFFGEKIFEILGLPRPEFVQSMQSNKMSSCMGAWFLGNTISQNLLNTGAFEVSASRLVLPPLLRLRGDFAHEHAHRMASDPSLDPQHGPFILV